MADLPDKTEKKAPVIEVTLLMPHTHDGKPCGKGDKINVTEAKADWLRNRGVIASSPTGAK